jgi:hypothetical protein
MHKRKITNTNILEAKKMKEVKHVTTLLHYPEIRPTN